MANPDFYNDNAFRSFPLVGDPTVRMRYAGTLEAPVGDGAPLLALPPSCIVDCGCVIYPTAQYDDSTDCVYLYHCYRRSSSLLRFIFRSTCPRLANMELVFDRTRFDGEYVTTYSQATLIAGESETVEQQICGDEPIWEGYLATGKFAELVALLPSTNDSLFFQVGFTPILEPGNIQNLRSNYVRSMTVGNEARTVVDNAAGCPSVIDAPSGIYIHSSCIVGDIAFKPGYNCSIRQDDQINTITFSAGVGAGEGQPCEEIPIFAEEESPDGGQLLSGGPLCSEVLKSINGLTGEAISFVAGTGVKILQVAADKLIIDFDLHDLQACLLGDDPPQPPVSEGAWHEEVITVRPLIQVTRGAAWRVREADGSLVPDNSSLPPEEVAEALRAWDDSEGRYLQLDPGGATEFMMAFDPMPSAIYEVISAQLQMQIQNAVTFLPDDFTARVYDAQFAQQVVTVKDLKPLIGTSEASPDTVGASLGLIPNSGYENWGNDPESPGVSVRIYADLSTPFSAPPQAAGAGLRIFAMQLLLTCRVPD